MKKLLALLLALTVLFGLVACGTPAADDNDGGNVSADGTIGTPESPVTVKIVCKDVFPD